MTVAQVGRDPREATLRIATRQDQIDVDVEELQGLTTPGIAGIWS
jgi:hypothetical protein